jgi:outer membrane receptor for ferrienterochelin and colicins
MSTPFNVRAASYAVVTLVFLETGSPAFAETADSADTTVGASGPSSPAAPAQLREIQVTAQRLNEARSSIETQTGASTYSIDAEAIAAIPGGENNQLNQVLLQAPDVVQDSFGQIHVRGPQ